MERLNELSHQSNNDYMNDDDTPDIMSTFLRQTAQSDPPQPSPSPLAQPDSVNAKSCVNCHCTSTPLWRKDKTTGLLYCNACGIYYKNHGKHRPVELIEGLPKTSVPQIAGALLCILMVKQCS